LRPIAPNLGDDTQHMIAENQPEYATLPAVIRRDTALPGRVAVITRWRFTPEERAAIARGEDLIYVQCTFGQPMHPVVLQVGDSGWRVKPTSAVPGPADPPHDPSRRHVG
jgi:hypothetical protein